MADNKLESQIWDFKSPEELAKALEENNKRLADRVREISQKSIEADSRDLRKRLQEELTPEEQLEIRETLPTSWVGKVLNKWLTKEEKQAHEAKKVVAWIMWEEVAEGASKLEWYSKSLWDAWEVAGKLFEEGKWIAALGVILKWLFWQFSLKAWEKKDEEKKPGNSTEIKSSDMKYLWGIKMLYLVKWDKTKKYTTSMLLQDEVKNKSFDELKTIYQWWKNWISSKINTSKWTDEEVYESLKLLIENENFMNSILWKANPEWRKWKISENLLDINKSWGYILDNVNTKLENITFSMNPVDAINQLKSVEMLNISFKDWKISFGDLEERKDLIKDISNETLVKLITTDESIKGSDQKQKERLYWLTKDENEKKFIDKLIDYKSQITNTLSWLFGEDVRKNYSVFFEQNGLSMKEILELYMITWGKSNLSDLNGLEKSSLYLKLWKILWKDESFRWEFYDQKVIEWLKNDTLPEDVKLILWNVFSKISEWFINSGTKALKEIWAAISTKDKIIIWWAIWILMIAMIRFAPIRVVWITAITAMLVNAISTTALANKYSEEKIREIVKESLPK